MGATVAGRPATCPTLRTFAILSRKKDIEFSLRDNLIRNKWPGMRPERRYR